MYLTGESIFKLWQQMLSEVYWFTYGTVFRWFLCYSVFLPLKIFVSSTPPRRMEIQHCNFAWSLVMVWSYVHRDNFLLLRLNMAARLPFLNFGYFVIKAYGYFWTWKNETIIMCVSTLCFKTLFKQTEFRALIGPFYQWSMISRAN